MKTAFGLIFFACLLSSATLFSQSTNSPYSILGIGDIETDFYNRTGGMANSGQAYRSDRFLINNNPASYTALQKQFFSFELAARGQFINYSGTPLTGTSASGKDFAIKRLSLGTKITSWWGSSAGLMPYSTSNYLFSSVKNIQGTNTSVPVTYDGNGGINQVYWSNAFQPFKHFSVGVKAAYLFGSLTQTENLTTEGLSTTLTTTRQIFYKNFNFLFGGQFYTAVNKKWDLSLGGTYNPTQKLKTDGSVTVTDNSSQLSNTASLANNSDFKLPNASGFGFSLTKNKKYTLNADYKYAGWTATNYFGGNYALRNSDRVSVGFEASNKVNYFNTLYEKSYLQAGVYYGNSYLQVNGQQLKQMGLTLGYGVNSKRNPKLGVSLGIDIGQRGTTQSNLIKENYVNFILTVSYRDLWNTKGPRYF
jgi:hypothetical protein